MSKRYIVNVKEILNSRIINKVDIERAIKQYAELDHDLHLDRLKVKPDLFKEDKDIIISGYYKGHVFCCGKDLGMQEEKKALFCSNCNRTIKFNLNIKK